MSNIAKPIIWIAEDDDGLRWVLQETLTHAGREVRLFADGTSLRQALDEARPDLVITDVRMPGLGGHELLEALSQLDITTIVISAFSDLDTTMKSYSGGAFEHLAKPFDIDELESLVEEALAANRSTPQGQATQPQQPDEVKRNDSAIVGQSAAMQQLFRQIGRVAKADVSVLITGETGTGKELVARTLHQHSRRSDGAFIALNTAAMPAELLESELFGHERGAFTGAAQQHIGRFEQAVGGTLFLDEIGDMPVPLQTRLLRVLAENEFYRVGGRELIRSDVRVIAATHQNLPELISENRFREDLYHRLNVVALRVPPLRERADDIPALVKLFLAEAAIEVGREPLEVRDSSMALLRSYHWPGNVRELENLCRRWAILINGSELAADHVRRDLTESDESMGNQAKESDWQRALSKDVHARLAQDEPNVWTNAHDALELTLINAALDFAGGVRGKAAEALGCGRNTLSRKLNQLEE